MHFDTIHRYRFLSLVAATALLGAAGWLSACHRTADLPADVAAATKILPDKVDYNLHIKPILSDRCFACHGPDANKQRAGLRLDIAENAYAALKESGQTPVKPGDVGGSELFHRIVSTDPDEVMPTPKSNLTLNAEEKALLIKWIEQGAEYKPHWSLVAPAKPAVPQLYDSGWARNDIDRFVWAKANEKKLTLAPEADKTTLLRRVSLDLTGLPPTPAEVDAFLADKSSDAYEKVVDHLLKSPHYGERMAVDWLDAARYADTHGYQDDGMRTMWPYRDWVIRAFNKNISFKTFITWQLAGDLLPPSKDETIARTMLVATAFNRNHQQSQEGGIVPAEYEAAYVGDRTDTFGKAMLGLTVECARCHDHKYDPISQKDYYALSAFFAQNNEFGQIPYNGEPSPHVTLPTPEADAQLKFIREQIRVTDGRDAKYCVSASTKRRFANWLKTNQQTSNPELMGINQDLMMHVPFDQFIDKKEGEKGKEKMRRIFTNLANDTLPLETHGDLDHPILFLRSPRGQGVRLAGESYLEFKHTETRTQPNAQNRAAWFERNQPFTVSVWVNVTDPKLNGPLFNRNLGPFNGFRGYEYDRLPDGRLAFRMSYVWPDDAIDIETAQKLPLNTWVLLTVTYDGTSRANGITLYANGQPIPTKIVTDNLTQSALWGKKRSGWGGGTPNFAIGQRHDYNYRGYSVDDLRVYARKLTPLDVRGLFTQQDELTAVIRNPKRNPAQEAALFDYFLTNVDKSAQENRLTRRALLGQETDVLSDQIDVMTMRERKTPRPTFILKRGAYDAPGDRVQPGVLHSLNQLPDNGGKPKNRLDLANWLLASDNPLFARVMVNRFWQQYFGQGLAKNSDDFGNQGALPSHPELLDYLAVQFRDSGGLSHGWNVKALQRLIVTSATYRQSSSVSVAAREADFDNTYLTRGPSYRMSAEQIRDNVLSASGLLTQRVGGPSVYPYQPGGIWEALATRNAVSYTQSHGDTLYRRSIYTIWKRSSPPPMMLNFDAAERHSCIVKRQKTSTPLQALVTLNDPQFVEAARVLAQRTVAPAILPECRQADTPTKTAHSPIGLRPTGTLAGATIINQFFKALASRPAKPGEVKILSTLYAEELADFQRNPKRAQTLLAVGEYPVNHQLPPAELAAWTVVASTVMNFDEAIIKR